MGARFPESMLLNILKSVPAKNTKLNSHGRLFSSLPNDVFKVLEEKIEDEVGFDQWLANTKDSLMNSKGRFWTGKQQPFPYNSAFKPAPVLSDSTKTQIFELNQQNSKLNDHRSLSLQFKVSIERIKAILCQKELELSLAKKGLSVDKDFIANLESNLECVNSMDEHADLQVKTHRKLPFRPLFSCVPEGRGFNFADAKEVILSSGIHVKSPSVEKSSASDSNCHESFSSKAIGYSDFENSRYKFIFVDVKKEDPSKSSILVRDRDGTLRKPSREEKEYASAKIWNRNTPESILN